MASNPEGWTIALERIAQEDEARTGKLDLRSLGLTELPEELYRLTHLRELNIGNALEGAKVSFFLKKGDVITIDGGAGQAMQGRKVNNFAGNFNSLRLLPNLKAISIHRLENFEIAWISQFKGLQSLDCSSTQVSDLSPLAGLSALQSLDCSSTQVSDLSPLAGLSALQSLDCSSTQVSDLSPLAGLSALQSLVCSRTQVSDLSPLSGLAGLQKLDCNRLKLAGLPAWLLDTPSLRHLSLYQADIAGIPSEVLSSSELEDCLPALRAHFLDEEGGSVRVVDVKLMVLGNGRVGKTQICRRLHGDPFDPAGDSTHGVSIIPASLNTPACHNEIVLKMWDFGGQDIYHGTHALFMRDNAIFALVWARDFERRLDDASDGVLFGNLPLRYWVDYVRHLGGRDRAVVVVQTRCDKPGDEHASPVSRTILKDAFGYCADADYSAKTDRGRANLEEKLAEAVAHLRARRSVASIGVARHKVKMRLEKMIADDAKRPDAKKRHRTLTQTEFGAICAKAKLKSDPRFLLDYLHRTGAVFHREGLFGDRIILDQNWALQAIYAVFDRERSYRVLRKFGGRFTRSLLASLVWGQFKTAEQQLFLDMMVSCGVCFVYRKGDEEVGVEAEYVAPELLPKREDVEAEIAALWDVEAEAVEQTFVYPFLHHGLIRAVIGEIGAEAGVSALYWRDGLCVYEQTTRARALIEQEMDEGWSGRIVVRGRGGQAHELLQRLCTLVERQQQRIGLDSTSIAAPAPKLAEEPREERPLVYGGERPGKPRTYVSYAWADASDPKREEKVDRLCEEGMKRGIEIIRDKTTLVHVDRISAFMQQIGGGDRVFIFLSDKYLHSPYCMFELFEMWRNSRQDSAEFSAACGSSRLTERRSGNQPIG